MITINELVGYLPWDLQIKDKLSGSVTYRLDGVATYRDGRVHVGVSNGPVGNFLHPSHVRPQLKKLDKAAVEHCADLINDVVGLYLPGRDVETVYSSETGEVTLVCSSPGTKGEVTYLDLDVSNLRVSIDHDPANSLQFIGLLYKHHFDVHGLISSGQADEIL